jgi:hypothetical protein
MSSCRAKGLITEIKILELVDPHDEGTIFFENLLTIH